MWQAQPVRGGLINLAFIRSAVLCRVKVRRCCGDGIQIWSAGRSVRVRAITEHKQLMFSSLFREPFLINTKHKVLMAYWIPEKCLPHHGLRWTIRGSITCSCWKLWRLWGAAQHIVANLDMLHDYSTRKYCSYTKSAHCLNNCRSKQQVRETTNVKGRRQVRGKQVRPERRGGWGGRTEGRTKRMKVKVEETQRRIMSSTWSYAGWFPYIKTRKMTQHHWTFNWHLVYDLTGMRRLINLYWLGVDMIVLAAMKTLWN